MSPVGFTGIMLFILQKGVQRGVLCAPATLNVLLCSKLMKRGSFPSGAQALEPAKLQCTQNLTTTAVGYLDGFLLVQ